MRHQQYEQLVALGAIDALTGAEADTLGGHLGGCPECRAEADAYREAGSMLAAQLDPVSPPPEVKRSIMNTISEPVEISDAEVDAYNNVEDGHFLDRRWWAAAAAIFLALWGWREFGVRTIRENVKAEEAVNHRLTEENHLLQERNERMLAQMQSLASPDTRTIALSGQQIAPAASAKVFMDPAKRKALVFFYNLPVNASDRSYQLWIIRADKSAPESAGTFDVNAQTGQSSITIDNLPVATEIKGLAVTLEPKGGVSAPTNTNFYLMGQSS